MTNESYRTAGARLVHLARRLWLALVLASVLPAAAQARFEIPGFELVHNAPVETTLETPDLRGPVEVWCEMFRRARRGIDIEQFYIAGQAGEPLDTVIGCLDAAGRRGVRIRFLMEERGQSASVAATIERVRAIPNLEYRILPWARVFGSGIIHAKFFIVDGRAAFVGSHNFDWRALAHIDETGLRITHRRIAGQLHRIFEQDWNAAALVAAGQPVPALRGESYAPMRGRAFLVASPNAYNPADIGDSQATLLRLIGEARREIRVEVMSYSTNAFGGGTYMLIDQALRAAAARGVQVRLLVANWTMYPNNLPGLESLDALPNVEIRVTAIPPAASGFIPFSRVVHTKIMTIDGRVGWVGTSNWEGGYLDNSRNVEVVMRDRRMAERLRALHEQMWSSTYSLPFAQARLIPRPVTQPPQPPAATPPTTRPATTQPR